ncbi:NADH-quinone oxidoreductase subunit L, partial [bacterium]
MIGRCNIMFSMAPVAMGTVATVGALTALFAGTIAVTQNDIKKVLAYSTVSQLGYMFLSMGVGAYVAGIFHLMTHAFFKACLFLGSGSVIHGMHDEQDMRKMGNLRHHMPHTYRTFLIATIAIAGIPPLAGFFSKDEILWMAFSRGFTFQWFLGFLAAGITAFYMFRLVFMTFFGKEKFDHHHVHPHESPASMYLPLYVLAGLSIVGGWLGIPEALGGSNLFHHWLAPVLDSSSSNEAVKHAAAMVGSGGLGVASAYASGGANAAAAGGHDAIEYVLMAASVGYALCGITVALYLYVKRPDIPGKIAASFKGTYNLLYNKYFVDEIYGAVFVDGCVALANHFWKFWDVVVIDGLVNGMASGVRGVGAVFAKFQNGQVQAYALSIAAGAVALALLVAAF